MYEEHEDGSFTLHMCEWYEQGRRLVGEYETLADGSGFAATDEWPAGLKVVVNHQLTRPDGTVMPGISRLRRFDWKVGPDEGLHADDYEIWERELREQAERDRFDGELRSLGALGDGESIFGRHPETTGRRLRMAMMACLIHERTKGSSMMTGYAGHPA